MESLVESVKRASNSTILPRAKGVKREDLQPLKCHQKSKNGGPDRTQLEPSDRRFQTRGTAEQGAKRELGPVEKFIPRNLAAETVVRGAGGGSLFFRHVTAWK